MGNVLDVLKRVLKKNNSRNNGKAHCGRRLENDVGYAGKKKRPNAGVRTLGSVSFRNFVCSSARSNLRRVSTHQRALRSQFEATTKECVCLLLPAS